MGYQYIFIITDITTHFMILRPLKSTEEVSYEFVKIICKLGFPKIIQSDNGSEFINKIMSAFISSYHSRANRAAESHVKLTKSMLLKSLKDSKPFELFFGRPLSYLDNDFNSISKLKTPREIIFLTKVMLQIIYPSIYKKKSTSTTNKIIHFSPRDKVMLKNSSANSKTDPKFLGPFIIHHCINNGAYVLQDITGNILPDKVSPSALKPVDPNTPFEEGNLRSGKGPQP
ncbi:Integrase catalytic domain-containing protein [Balamuthia mandrillaris]